MKYTLLAGFIGSLLGGSCALATILLVVLIDRSPLEPVEPLRPREAAVLSSWATSMVVTILPVIETPLPPADTPALETLLGLRNCRNLKFREKENRHA